MFVKVMRYSWYIIIYIMIILVTISCIDRLRVPLKAKCVDGKIELFMSRGSGEILFCLLVKGNSSEFINHINSKKSNTTISKLPDISANDILKLHDLSYTFKRDQHNILNLYNQQITISEYFLNNEFPGRSSDCIYFSDADDSISLTTAKSHLIKKNKKEYFLLVLTTAGMFSCSVR